MDKILPIGDLNYPIGDIIPNWVCFSVSPLIRHKLSPIQTVADCQDSYRQLFTYCQVSYRLPRQLQTVSDCQDNCQQLHTIVDMLDLVHSVRDE